MNRRAGHHVRRAFDRAAETYDAAASVQQQVVRNLLEQLSADARSPDAPSIERPANPDLILDLGCGTGFAFPLLHRRFPAARIIGLDFAESMLRNAPAGHQHLQKIAANATLLPLADGCTDLVFSSMALQWCPLELALGEARRVLRPAGQLAFSTLTGQTFHQLRDAFAGIDEAPHVLPLLDQEQIQAAVRAAGFGGLTCHRQTHLARFASVGDLFASIRNTGASQVAPAHAPNVARRRGMLGKTAFATIKARLEAQADDDGLLPLTYEVLYLRGQKT